MLCKSEHVAIDVRFKFERVFSARSPLIRVETEPAVVFGRVLTWIFTRIFLSRALSLSIECVQRERERERESLRICSASRDALTRVYHRKSRDAFASRIHVYER